MTGGAHVLDVCVALTERQDEDEQMREVVQRISLTQPAPIQVDSTEPEVIEAARSRRSRAARSSTRSTSRRAATRPTA